MKEKLLAALKTKFQGVQDATLERIATKKAETITEEDQIQNVVDGLKYDDIIQSETDFRVNQASKTAREKAVSEYEKKHNLKDGKPQKAEGNDDDPPADPPGGEDEKVPKWAQKLIKENTELKTTLQGITKSQEVGTKREQALKLLQDSKIDMEDREYYAGLINYESETPLEDQIKLHESKYLESAQRRINNAVAEGNLAPGGGGSGEFKTEEVDDYLNEKFPEKAEK